MNAEEMFKEIGYEKTYDGDYSIVYTKEVLDEDRYEIEFFKMITQKQVRCSLIYVNEFEEEIQEPLYVDMEELQAINKQCEELGWC